MTHVIKSGSQYYHAVGETIARGFNAQALGLLVLEGIDGSALEIHVSPSFETREERMTLARKLVAMLRESAERIEQQIEQVATNDTTLMPMGRVPTGDEPS